VKVSNHHDFPCFILTAIADQTNHKNNFESVASQRFQNYSWFGFERKAL
jgi:hypothetical protein